MNKCFLHMHSEYSLYDGIITPNALIAKMDELQARTVAITDHGNMMSVDAFYEAFKKANKCREDKLKYIPGIEAYISSESCDKPAHLVILAKDFEGYRALIRACTEANNNIQHGEPVMTYDNLNDYFGPGSTGHGHVLAMSACIAGPICSWLLHNYTIYREYEKCMNKAERSFFDVNEYNSLKEQLESLTLKRNTICEVKARLKELKNKKYAQRKKSLMHPTFENQDIYDDLVYELEKEIEETEKAKNDYPVIESEEKNISRLISALRTKMKKQENKKASYDKHCSEAQALLRSEMTRNEMYAKAKDTASQLADIFGREDFYLEIQYHGIEKESVAYPQVVEIAQELSLHIVATNDCHTIDNTSESRRKRQIMRSLRYNSWEDEMVGDDELYMKTDAELKRALCEILPERIVDMAIEENMYIGEKCNVLFEEHPEHYPKFKVPEDFNAKPFETEGGTRADAYLRYITSEAVKKKYKRIGKGQYEGFTKEYKERVNYELEIIKKLKVADYFLIVRDFLEYGRLIGKIDLANEEYIKDPYNKELLEKLAENQVGFAIGVGRGSAVGSLVCYLIGITDIDPLKYNLLFERFLNPSRVTMPDIDSDFSNLIRDKVIDYVCDKYGHNAVCCIMTKDTQALKDAIHNCARVYSDGKYGDKKILQELGNAICKAIPNELNIKMDDCYEDLKVAFAHNSDALQIIEDAKLVEGTFITIGKHAAGVIIADNGDVREYIPLMKNNDGIWSSQTDANYVEAKGLLKMDFLGLRNLAVITECLKSIQMHYNISIDMQKIDLCDPNVYKNIFQNGNTDNVFQFASPGMKNLLKKFKPENIEHLTLLNALYRPGPLQYADALCTAKNNPEKRPRYICSAAKEILELTYGYPVYQEQVMQLFNKAAGFSLGESDIIRRYMSKKKTEAFMTYKKQFVDGLVDNGASVNDSEQLWDQLVEFSKYAFNKSHSCAYAITAYYTAWLKYYYPKEYLSACLNDAKFEDFEKTFAELKSTKIQLKQPNINTSNVLFTADKNSNTISYGLGKIKMVAASADAIIAEREANGDYISFEDFMARTKCKKNVAENLINAGAFDVFISEHKNVYLERKNYLKLLKSDLIPDTQEKALCLEKNAIGSFLSANPTACYVGKNTIASMVPNNDKKYYVVGVISETNIKKTKSGKDMATFKLDDGETSIKAVCFPDAFSKYSNYIKDNTVLLFTGTCNHYNEEILDANDLQFYIEEIKLPQRKISALSIYDDYTKYSDIISLYECENGIPLYIFDDGKVLKELTIDPKIVKDKRVAKILVSC